MKKLFTFFLLLVASIGTMFAGDYKRVQIGDLYYNLDATNQTAEVTSQNSSSPYWSTTITTANIPASVEYNSVTYSVTSIGKEAFFGSAVLTSVTIPNSVTSIGERAFQNCTGLTSVTIGNSVTSIGANAFNQTAITSIIIPENVLTIGECAFSQCSELTEVRYNAINCTDLSYKSLPFIHAGSTSGFDVIIGNKVKKIPSNIFSNKDLIPITIHMGDYWVSNPKYPFFKVNSITFEEGSVCESIGSYAFYGDSITTLSLPSSISTISSYALGALDKLSSLDYQGTIEQWCAINFPYDNDLYREGLDIYIGGEKFNKLVLPEGVNKIGTYAFKNFSNVYGDTCVFLPQTLKHISYGAFDNCSSLKAISYTGTCDEWCKIQFDDNPLSLAHNLYIQEDLADTIILNVDTLLYNTFINCLSLKHITLTETLKKVDYGVFTGCTNLSQINCLRQRPPLAYRESFDDANFNNCTLYVPAGREELYWTAEGWREFANILPIQENPTPCVLASGTCGAEGDNLTWELSCDRVLTISGNGAMLRNSWEIPWDEHQNEVRSVFVEDGVTTIGATAFRYCYNLSNVVIGKDVTTIYEDAFFNDSALSSITCKAINPPVLSTLKSGVFYGVDKSIPLYVPGPSLDLYRAADGWKDFTNILPVPGTEVACEPYIFPYDTTVCARSGDIWWREHVYTNINVPGTYQYHDSLLTVDGCDSIYELNLTVLPSYNYVTQDTISIVRGESVIISKGLPWQRIEYPEETTIYGDTMFTVFGCDSMVSHYVIVTEPSFPVTFLDYNGEVLSEQNVEYNQAAKAPEVPAREGYTFSGWSTDIEHIVARTFAIALYDKIGGTLTYLSEEGDVIATENVDLHLPAAPIIAGKSFKGWLTESADSENGIVLRATYTSDKPDAQEDVTITPSSNSAYVIFPFITGALTYQLVIRDLFGNVVCKIMFSATGHLLGIAFAPSRNRESQQATQTTGFNFTVEGLDESTTYEYEFVANDGQDAVIETLSGSFTTTAKIPTDNEQVNSPSAVRKYLEDGHLMIDANSHIFNTQGKMIK